MNIVPATDFLPSSTSFVFIHIATALFALPLRTRSSRYRNRLHSQQASSSVSTPRAVASHIYLGLQTKYVDKIQRDRALVCVLATDGIRARARSSLAAPLAGRASISRNALQRPWNFFVVSTSFHTYCTISRASVVVSSYNNN